MNIDNDGYWLPFGIDHENKSYTSVFLRTKDQDGKEQFTLRMIDRSAEAERYRASVRDALLRATYVLYYNAADKPYWDMFWTEYHSEGALRRDFIQDLTTFRRGLTH